MDVGSGVFPKEEERPQYRYGSIHPHGLHE